jgi:mannose-1-phosphate guanylyltransferase
MKTNNYCVILAGGKGRRLWPCSRDRYPKQFVDFFGTGRTQLQQTYDRMAKILPPDHIYVNTNVSYLSLVQEQLPEIPADNIMAEPIHRNTAPSVAWATHRINRLNPDANLIVTPSDQIVLNEEAFRQNVEEGFDFVDRRDCLLSMGIKPTRPEPGYGYIQLGDEAAHDVYRVQSFTEKPEREFAKMFMKSGEFYWNTGIFLSNTRFLGRSFFAILPSVLRNLDAVKPDWTIEEESKFVHENFPSYPNLSIDYGILEKSEDAYVMKCDFGWADIGTWHSIYEAMRKGPDDNVVIDSDVMIEDSSNNVIKLPKGKFAVINGLEGFIVAEKDNVLLICKKEDSSALVRKYVNEVQMKKGDDYI